MHKDIQLSCHFKSKDEEFKRKFFTCVDQMTVCELQNNKIYIRTFMDILYLNSLKTITLAILLWHVTGNIGIALPASVLVTKVSVSVFVPLLYTDHKNLLWPLAKRSFSSWAFFRITFFCASSKLLVCRSTLRSNGRLSLSLPSSFSFCKFKRKIKSHGRCQYLMALTFWSRNYFFKI